MHTAMRLPTSARIQACICRNNGGDSQLALLPLPALAEAASPATLRRLCCSTTASPPSSSAAAAWAYRRRRASSLLPLWAAEADLPATAAAAVPSLSSTSSISAPKSSAGGGSGSKAGAKQAHGQWTEGSKHTACGAHVCKRVRVLCASPRSSPRTITKHCAGGLKG